MFRSDSLSTNPHKAKQQLWNRLPGKYILHRDKHLDMVFNRRIYTTKDIADCYGESEITSRASTDPAYQSELLQESLLYLITKTRVKIEQRERRVFRLQDGEWSLWKTDREGIVVEKITELRLGHEIYSSSANLRGVGLPWVGGNGIENVYLGFDFHMSDGPWWTMHHKIARPDKYVTVQGTHYRKMTKAQQEGWASWLAEGVMKGFVGMKEYLSG